MSNHRFGTISGYNPVTATLDLKTGAYSYMAPSTNINLTGQAEVNFTFLNISQNFRAGNVDWNFEDKGKLWNYNLNYFDFLFSDQLDSEEGKCLIEEYCHRFSEIKGGVEPYPISLRGINWIKFFSRQKLIDDKLNETLYRQYSILMANVEYHILANHLLENGFSLLFAAYFFQNENFYRKAKSILLKELDEQILDDGAHFERSPMYHQIILFRILDCVNLVQNNSWKANELLSLLEHKAEVMLLWLKEITFTNGDIPMVKDSAYGIAPDGNWLSNYAKSLEVYPSAKVVGLGKSGYRKLVFQELELLADVGSVSPSYQPSHAHADETNFVLYFQGRPMIVDTGVSTYEKDEKRKRERSTSSHNCIVINDHNSSEVWAGFRVAKRAGIQLLRDEENVIAVSHSGYSRYGITITRTFKKDHTGLIIHDVVNGEAHKKCELYLHIHPDILPEVNQDKIFLDNLCIELEGVRNLIVDSYQFAKGFNKTVEGKLLRLEIESEIILRIKNAD